MNRDLQEESRRLLGELERADGWDFDERTSPQIHVHLPGSSKRGKGSEPPPSWYALVPPRYRWVVAIVLGVLTALGAARGLL